MRPFLAFILKYAARFVIWRTKPLIIGITGSVGKTSTKEAIFAVLKTKFRVRASWSNFNTEIGLPSSILGMHDLRRNPVRWVFGILAGVLKALVMPKENPEILVLEYAAAKPGDIQYLVSVARPSIAVVTAIGEIPVHVEFFAGPKHIAREKGELVATLPTSGCAVLNFDDDTVLDMRELTRARVMTFGFGEGADVRAIHYELRTYDDRGGVAPSGISFKVERDGNVVPVRLPFCYGKSNVYAALAAISVAAILGVPLLDAVEALAGHKPLKGRMRILPGIKNTWILDDAYNAAPASTTAALETLAEFNTKGRKIAVLGDMLELGKYEEAAHRTIGERAGKAADIILTVGDRARLFLADEAMARGKNKEEIFMFGNADEAGKKLQAILKPDDLILIKGSHAMHMEKIVEEISALSL